MVNIPDDEWNEVVTALRETRAQVNDLLMAAVANAAAGAGQATAIPPPPNNRLVSIIDANLIGKVGIFSGNDDAWKNWCFVFESTTGLIDLGAILTASETAPDEVGLAYGIQSEETKPRTKAL